MKNSTNWKLSLSILQSLGIIQYLFVLWIWLTVGTKLHLINNSIVTDKLFPYQMNFLHLVVLLRQLSQDHCCTWVFLENVSPYQMETIPLDCLSQTLFYRIKGNLFPLNELSITLSQVFNYCFRHTESVVKMKENKWQLLLCLVFRFMVGLPICSPNIYDKIYWVFATYFSPLFSMHYYSHVATIFAFVSDYSVKLLSPICLPSVATKKLIVKFLAPKLQKIILFVTRKDVQLDYWFVSSVPISPKHPKTIRIIKRLRNTEPQNVVLLSSVNFDTNSFQEFTFYVNIRTPNMVFLWKQQMWILTISSSKMMIRILERSCVNVNISL